MNDRQLEELIAMADEAGRLDDPDAADPRREGCLPMNRWQACAGNGRSLTAEEASHVAGCRLCIARLRAWSAGAPRTATRHAAPRWLEAVVFAAAAACVGLALTLAWRRHPSPRPLPNAPRQLAFVLADSPSLAVPAVCVRGDSNCDGAINVSDIAAFSLALHRPDEYVANYPTCDRLCSNDMNGDCVVDDADLGELLVCVGG